jgi:hypothetical protein
VRLGLHDRYCLSRHLIGAPPILVFGAALPASSSTYETSDVIRVSNELLERHVWLRYAIDVNAHPPKWTLNPAIAASDVVVSTQADLSLDEILLSGILSGDSFDLEKGPLWRVHLQTPRVGESTTVMLVVHHAAFDGCGTSQLFGQLLSGLLSPASISDAPKSDIPPMVEKTIDMRPSYGHLVGEVWKSLVVPRLPAFLQPAPIIVWPNPPSVVVHEAAPRVACFQVELDIISAAKKAARAMGINTLHPVLHAAALAALQKTFLCYALDGEVAVVSTPISLRSAALGHPPVAGNFVASHSHSYTLPVIDDFWTIARKFAEDATSSAGAQRARAAMGMLAYLPDSAPAAPGADSGWDAFFRGRAESERPFSASIELSNVGLLEAAADLAGVQAAWAQSASPIGAGVCLNVRLPAYMRNVY